MSTPRLSDQARDRSRFGWAVNLVPSVVYVAVIFYGGLIHLGALPEVGPVPTDKLLHALTFGGLVLLLHRSVAFIRPALGPGARFWSSVLAASAIGALLEVLQSLTSYRSADFFDWLADTLGALAAGGLLLLARQLLIRRSHA